MQYHCLGSFYRKSDIYPELIFLVQKTQILPNFRNFIDRELTALEINNNSRFQQACGILLSKQYKHCISTARMPMATKLSRVVTYLL